MHHSLHLIHICLSIQHQTNLINQPHHLLVHLSLTKISHSPYNFSKTHHFPMDSIPKQIYNRNSQSLPSVQDHPNTPYQPPLPTSAGTGFPILAIAVLCIMATTFVLVSYYIFVTKCCINWQQFDPLRRFSITRSPPPPNEEPLTAYSPSWQSRGLDELLIREIPTFQYSTSEGEERKIHKCVVCLNEFNEQDTLRVLPNCNHGFHLDCIDIWLQSSANCPLCRLSISGKTRYPIDRIIAPTSSPQDPQPFISGLMGSDEDFVVIELSGETRTGSLSRRHQERDHQSPRKFEKLKTRKFHHVSIMGDECIDIREKDNQFSVQPIRRSFSMDSAADRHVYLSVQEIIRENRHMGEIRNDEERVSRVRRPFFSLGHGRGSRSAVLPVEF